MLIFMHVMALKICLYTVAFLGGMKSRKKKRRKLINSTIVRENSRSPRPNRAELGFNVNSDKV